MPDSQREGAYALGATRWQMVRGSVLPAAAPGIMTGIILAMARAIGEAAPLILVGAVTFVTFLPTPFQEGYTVLPIQVYNWASRPQNEFQGDRRGDDHRRSSSSCCILNAPRAHRSARLLETHPVVEETAREHHR